MANTRLVSLGISAAFLIAAGIGSSCTSGDDNAAPDQTDASTGGDANLGDASPTDSSPPTDANLDAGSPAVLFSGGYNSCLLKDGVLKCWGADDYGNLGNATIASAQSTPTVVPGISPTTVAIARNHICAANLTTTWCWGSNGNGTLGHDPLLDPDAGDNACFGEPCAPTPIAIAGFTGVKALAAEYYESCAITSGGTVSCWGDDFDGQLGIAAPDGGELTTNGRPMIFTPTSVPGVTGAIDLVTGISGFRCILQTSPGVVTCWGADYWGYLGGNATDGGPNIGAPVTIAGITNATAITSGGNHLCALLADKTVKCWGANTFASLGHNPDSDPQCGPQPCDPTPTTVPGLSDVTAISSSNDFTCALKSDATVECWGNAQGGALDVDPATEDSGFFKFQATPRLISGLPPVAQIAVGWYHACALTVAGDVYCWGDDQYDQLGAAGLTFTPVKIEGL